jgi:general secretion pathway protein L
MADFRLAQAAMSVLRIYCSLSDPPVHCAWVLAERGRSLIAGEGALSAIPRRADSVEIIIPATQVMITRVHLPPSKKKRSAALLAYALEDETLPDPAANYTCRLGSAADGEVLAVVDNEALTRWLDAVDALQIGAYEVHCETLLLPWREREWSLAWDGVDGFVRTGALEGAATDCGDRQSPPLSLLLTLEQSAAPPDALAVYVTTSDAEPDVAAWSNALGLPVHVAGTWDWRSAATAASVALVGRSNHWSALHGSLGKLRPAAWLAGTALAIHAIALCISWGVLAAEQRRLHRTMESQFRSAFPDAAAVVDPALQMRRKLAEIRHTAGKSDEADFLPMLEKAAAAVKELPPGSVRTTSYDAGRLSLEIVASEATLRGVLARLREMGLTTDTGAGTVSGSTLVTLRPA